MKDKLKVTYSLLVLCEGGIERKGNCKEDYCDSKKICYAQ
jgi:hypothetical protein